MREIEAPSRFAVYEQIKNEGGLVVLIAERHGFSRAWFSRFNILIGTGVTQDDLITMTKNLSGMLRAGLSLSRALSVIGKQSGKKRLRTIVHDLEESVRKGDSFHDALTKHANVFSSLYRAMVRAGEESGGLAESLSIVGIQMERTSRLVRKIRGALMYPAIILVAIVAVFVLMMIYVVPTLTKTFVDLEVELPLATRIIAAISDFMAINTWFVLLAIGAFVVSCYLFVRSKRGGALVLRPTLYLPVIGTLVCETYAARASRTLSSLLSSGVPVLRVLEISGEVLGANVFGSVIDEARERVRRGEPLSAAFIEHANLFPMFMGDMLLVGEETGKVADMLKQVAEFYEEDVDQKTKDLSAIIEPVIMLVVGSGVGIFAVAMIAPIYSLSSAM